MWVKPRLYYATAKQFIQGIIMFSHLAAFCKKTTNGSVLSITTIWYMEQIDDLDGATMKELIIEAKDRGNINKMLASHEDWFKFKKPKGNSVGRPGRRIYLSLKGKRFINSAKKAYIEGLEENK